MNTKKKNKALAFTILILLVGSKLSAQIPDLLFEKRFPYQIQNSYLSLANKPYCYITEVLPSTGSESFCLMTVNHQRQCAYYEEESVSPPLVYKVSHQGELLGEMTLGYEDRYCFVYDLYQTSEDSSCFLAVGIAHNNDLHYDRPFMVKFDQDMNLLWRREVELPEPYRGYLTFGCVMDRDGRVVCSSYLYDCSSGNNYSRFCFRLTPECELDGLLDLSLQSNYQKVFEYLDGSDDYGLLENVQQDDQLLLLRVNRDMELIGQQTIPNRYEEMDPTNTFPVSSFSLFPPQYSTSGRHAVTVLPDGSMVLANEASIYFQNKAPKDYHDYYGAGFLWVSAAGEAFAFAMDGEKTTHDSLVMLTPVLPTGDGGFYFVYAMGANGGYDYMNCFVVGKMDLGGNLLWRRYWNRYLPQYDMKIYFPQDAIVSQDGGCLISGFSFKSNINATGSYTYEPDVFLLKFFADGTLPISEKEGAMRPFYCYPNPVEDVLRVEYSPDIIPEAVELYDVQGRLVHTQHNNLENIGMENLPTGTYTLRIIMKGGEDFTEKVVKAH